MPNANGETEIEEFRETLRKWTGYRKYGSPGFSIRSRGDIFAHMNNVKGPFGRRYSLVDPAFPEPMSVLWEAGIHPVIWDEVRGHWDALEPQNPPVPENPA